MPSGSSSSFRRAGERFFWAGAVLILLIAMAAYSFRSPMAFKMYYALGASMFPGWAGVGSLQAAFGRRASRWPAVFVLALSAVQLGLTLPAAVDMVALEAMDGTNGEGVLVRGGWVVPTVLFNTSGLAMAAIAAFFAWWLAFRVQQPRTAGLAIGLSVVVIALLTRSAGAYRMLAAAGAPGAFLVLDASALVLLLVGATVTYRSHTEPTPRLEGPV